VLLVTAAAIGLALLAVLGGVLYDQLWLPSRPVATAGGVSLSRGDYWAERKSAFAREIVQNFQLVALFGGNPQFTQQFQGQAPVIDQRIGVIRSSEVDSAVVDQWIDRQVKEQGASARGISVADEEINQAMVADLGLIFLPPDPPPAGATPVPTEDLPATATALAAPTATPGGPTPTAAPTATEAPTFTPEPTPAPAEAATQVDQIIAEVFRRYELELTAVGLDPNLTAEDFRAALRDQYREQVINTKVQEQLVPEEGFSFSTEPQRVTARQVLVAVETPDGATQEQIDAAFAEARTEADEIAAELRGGADFDAVAAERSDDPGSREQGGSLGSFDANGISDSGVTYPPELVQAAFALEAETISDPIRTQFGWHVIEVTERDVPSEEQQLRQARTEALDTWVEEQRAAATVQRFPEPTVTPTVAPTEPVPSPVPTFLPGPPTAVPTPTVAPTEAPAGTPAPTATATP
jgi:parvulin-like peptidyl-prolyl isomerase